MDPQAMMFIGGCAATAVAFTLMTGDSKPVHQMPDGTIFHALDDGAEQEVEYKTTSKYEDGKRLSEYFEDNRRLERWFGPTERGFVLATGSPSSKWTHVGALHGK